MKFARFLAPALIVSLSAAALADKPKGKGWVALFNGKDLTGWELKSDLARKIWTVKDGVIDNHPLNATNKEDRNLYTTKEYKDFVLHIEWRIKELKGIYNVPTVLPDGSDKLGPDGKPVVTPQPGADSGIYIRGSSKAQVNIWNWPIGSGEMYGYRRDKNMPAEVRAGVTPKVRADKPVGEWNIFVITVKGNHITTELNGQKVVESELPGLPEQGPLVLQTHGGFDEKKQEWNGASSLVQFRNIYIRELK